MDAGRGAAANKAEEEVNQFLRGLVLSMKDCSEPHLAHAQTSENNRSSMVAEILCKVESKLQNIVSGQSVLGNGFLDVGRGPPSRDFCLFGIVLCPMATLWLYRHLMRSKPQTRLP